MHQEMSESVSTLRATDKAEMLWYLYAGRQRKLATVPPCEWNSPMNPGLGLSTSQKYKQVSQLGQFHLTCGWYSVNQSIAKPSAANRARRQSGFPTFISCQRQDANVLPKRRQSHQGDKLCDVSTVSLVARWPVFLASGSDTDGEPHYPTHEINE